jgi:hypothetical protein
MKEHNPQYASVDTDDVEAPGAHSSKKARPLTLLPLIAIIFFEVSGGPFGTEVSIETGQQPSAILRMQGVGGAETTPRDFRNSQLPADLVLPALVIKVFTLKWPAVVLAVLFVDT